MRIMWNKDSFAKKGNEVHGNRYDYSKVEYVNNRTPVVIICPVHGEFLQKPEKHLIGHGCPECRATKKRTIDDFLKEAATVHGDKYDYSKSDYVNNTTKVCIICKEHGEFWQTPKEHLHGQGCPACGKIRRGLKKRENTESFIEKARKVHGDLYDYSKTVYVKSNQNVIITCKEHGDFEQTPNAHLSGCGCPKCVGKGVTTEEIIRRFRETHGDKYDYSKVVYNPSDNTHKVLIGCNKHGYFEQSLYAHIKGQGCPKCGNEIKASKLSFTCDEFIRKANEVHNGKFDYSKVEYVNSLAKVCIICPVHGEFWQVAGNHLNGQGCPECAKEHSGEYTRSNNEKFIENAKLVHGDEYDYSKVDYVNNRVKVMITCKIHGDFEQTPHNHLNGQGCPKCKAFKIIDKITSNTDEFIEKAKKIHGDKYDYSKVEYTRNSIPVEIICNKHGSFIQTPASHLSGCGCPKCAFHLSKGEDDIYKLVKQYDDNAIQRTKKIIPPFELDIYSEKYNLAIEFDGLIWHSEKYNTEYRKSHLNKTKLCNDKGIRLIHVFEDEWNYKRDIVISRIKSIIGITERRIFARKCDIIELDDKACSDFLENNHIQGNVSSKYRYGLVYNGELVSVMTFGKTRKNLGRKSAEGEYELVRFCSKLGVSVVGGGSKLLSYFVRNMSPKKIITYADLRWSDGNFYRKLGFTLSHVSSPNYYYVNGNIRENRFKYRKDVLVSEGYDKDKSEHEIMLEREIYRIYDCGNMVFEKCY